MDLVNVDRGFYPRSAEYTFFLRAQNIFQNKSYVIPQKVWTNLRSLKSYQAYFLTIMIWNQKSIQEHWKIHRQMKIYVLSKNQ
jgi:hypothetical protein